MIRTLRGVLLVGAWLITSHAVGFPELVRRGYGNCTTCHYSPTGGGILTEYGRSLIPQVLSSGGTESESKFLWGAFDLPDWLSFGGDFRSLGAYQTFSGQSSFAFIFMQADAETAVSVDKFSAVATFGVDHDGSAVSRRHYLQYHVTDEINARAGRFMPAYGLNTEDHTIAIKRGLGKDQATESYNLELSWIGENLNVFATAVFGRLDNLSLGAESGAAFSASLYFEESYKVGVSYFYGYRSSVEQRHLTGPYAILGFTPHITLLAELDFQFLSPQAYSPQTNSIVQTGAVDDVRLDFEILQGLHLYGVQEFEQLDFNNSNTFSDAYGAGVQFFPRPHFELNVLYQRRRIGGTSAPFGDLLWGLLHVYL